MSDKPCSHCKGTGIESPPPEPPIGTWVRDKYDGVSVRCANGKWAPAPSGFYPLASWEPMWQSRGPLVVCGPWGADLQEVSK